MNFENGTNKKRGSGKEIVKGTIQGAIAGAGLIAGVELESWHKSQELIKHPVLTEITLSELKQETGATDDDISKLEAHVKQLLIEELRRIKDTR